MDNFKHWLNELELDEGWQDWLPNKFTTGGALTGMALAGGLLAGGVGKPAAQYTRWQPGITAQYQMPQLRMPGHVALGPQINVAPEARLSGGALAVYKDNVDKAYQRALSDPVNFKLERMAKELMTKESRSLHAQMQEVDMQTRQLEQSSLNPKQKEIIRRQNGLQKKELEDRLGELIQMWDNLQDRRHSVV